MGLVLSDFSDSFGMVYLVGAGPGDPGMITLRAVECLKSADVVLYDYLCNDRILAHANPQAELICLGSHGQGRIWDQDSINRAMVERSRAGQRVVRLKGGDPAIFARGAEEAEYLRSEDVSFEIVPGITAALAAGSCAGIPITHRDLASAVALVTGREKSGQQWSDSDYHALAQFPGTIVIYMGTTTVDRWSQGLIDGGKPVDTPVAIIRRCGFPDQTVAHCRLDEVGRHINRHPKTRPPVIFIVGEVTRLADRLDWFQKRPLFGMRVLVTRPPHQAHELIDRLGRLGADTTIGPAITIRATDDQGPLREAYDGLSRFGTIVFSSSNGVHYFIQGLLDAGYDLRKLGHARLAVVGPGTAAALRKYHLHPDLVPQRFDADCLAAELVAQPDAGPYLLIRASRGREVLAERLTAAGRDVMQVVAYQSDDCPTPTEALARQVRTGQFDWITVTSSAIARSLHTQFGEALNSNRLVSISPVTSATLRELGLEPAAEALEATMDGLVDAIVTGREKTKDAHAETPRHRESED